MSEKPNQDGAWIFVSHSNKDMKKVREIRDVLEREGHHGSRNSRTVALPAVVRRANLERQRSRETASGKS